MEEQAKEQNQARYVILLQILQEYYVRQQRSGLSPEKLERIARAIKEAEESKQQNIILPYSPDVILRQMIANMEISQFYDSQSRRHITHFCIFMNNFGAYKVLLKRADNIYEYNNAPLERWYNPINVKCVPLNFAQILKLVNELNMRYNNDLYRISLEMILDDSTYLKNIYDNMLNNLGGGKYTKKKRVIKVNKNTKTKRKNTKTKRKNTKTKRKNNKIKKKNTKRTIM